jgi:hypothetical protein
VFTGDGADCLVGPATAMNRQHGQLADKTVQRTVQREDGNAAGEGQAAPGSTRQRQAGLGVGPGRCLSGRGYGNAAAAPERVPVACARMIASSWAPNRNTIAEM